MRQIDQAGVTGSTAHTEHCRSSWLPDFLLGLLLQLLCVGAGWCVQAAHGPLAVRVLPPWNWVFVLLPVALAVAMGVNWRTRRWLCWLSGSAFAVASITLLVLMCLLGAIVPQDPARQDWVARLGVRALFSSLPFVVLVCALLLNLATVIGRRLINLQRRDIAFLLNHVGMLLIIIGMFAGRAQLVQATLALREGDGDSVAVDEAGVPHQLDAWVRLKRFEIASFPPRLGAVRSLPGAGQQSVTSPAWVANGQKFAALDLRVQVLAYLPMAVPDMVRREWRLVKAGGVPAAHVRVALPNGQEIDGWVAPGSTGSLEVDGEHAIFLTDPQPSAYRSYVELVDAERHLRNVTLEVNHPIASGRWLLYQMSYQQEHGRYTSVLQAVTDPTLPVVYAGFLCLLPGAFFACWFPVKRRRDQRAFDE